MYGSSLKSLSCRVSLSTMDCLFNFNKACMNEKPNHLTNVSAAGGDKQGGEELEGGGGDGMGWERGVCLEFCEAIHVCATVPRSQRAIENNITLCLRVCGAQLFNIFGIISKHNLMPKWIPSLVCFCVYEKSISTFC